MKPPRYVGLQGRGDTRVVVRFSVAHGKGHRYDQVEVPIAEILRVADAYRGCLADTSLSYPGDTGHRSSHACWHAEHPAAPIPCSNAVAVSPAPDLAQIVRNYLGARDRVSALQAELAFLIINSTSREQIIAHDLPIHEGHRDEALAAMRKAVL